MKKPLCIFHSQDGIAHCADGFGAAWVVQRRTGDLFEFYPGEYGKPPPNVTDRHVLLVDFSYKRPVLEEMAKQALSITILDHHKTAQEDLAIFPVVPEYGFMLDYWEGREPGSPTNKTTALFDMERSGAGITWDYFEEHSPRIRFINYLEDRDLWKKQLGMSDEFTIALCSHPQTFEKWNVLADNLELLLDEGVSIQRYFRLRVEELKRTAYLANIGGYTCAVANTPHFAASEVAGELCSMEGAEFGACFFEQAKGKFQYSLRSRDDFDVSRIAKRYGGGGHKNAAGFNVDFIVHN